MWFSAFAVTPTWHPRDSGLESRLSSLLGQWDLPGQVPQGRHPVFFRFVRRAGLSGRKPRVPLFENHSHETVLRRNLTLCLSPSIAMARSVFLFRLREPTTNCVRQRKNKSSSNDRSQESETKDLEGVLNATGSLSVAFDDVSQMHGLAHTRPWPL